MNDTNNSYPSHPSSQNQQKGQVTPMGAGLAGAIAGAALGAAAAVALSDPETRKKVQKNIKILKDKAVKVMDTLEKVDEEDVVTKSAEDIKKTAEDVKKNVDETSTPQSDLR